MKFKKPVSLIVICLVLLNTAYMSNAQSTSSKTDVFAVLKDYKRVRSIKAKNGELLGYIYVRESSKFKNGILSELLVAKDKGGRLDTLYHINDKGFFNAKKKVERKFARDYHFYGFELSDQSKNITDNFAISFADKKGIISSDDNDFLIDWNYKTKSFYYYPMP